MKVLSFGPKDACVAYTLSEMGALHESKRDMAMVRHMLQCVAMCCRVLQGVAGCCSVL